MLTDILFMQRNNRSKGDCMEFLRVDDTFKLVYQGGHHNIYCNGNIHIKTSGGFCHPSVSQSRVLGDYSFKCDCDKWRQNAT